MILTRTRLPVWLTKIIRLLLALLFQATAAFATPSVWLEIKNATSFEEEFIRRSLNNLSEGIVQSKRDPGTFQEGNRYDGGIQLTIIENGHSCFSTRRFFSYNLDDEQIVQMSILIDRNCLDQYQEENRYYAFRNAIDHEYFCHAVTQSRKHTQWGLCRAFLSTDKLYWGKRHRRYVRENLNLPGRTGVVLDSQARLTDTEGEVMCEIGGK